MKSLLENTHSTSSDSDSFYKSSPTESKSSTLLWRPAAVSLTLMSGMVLLIFGLNAEGFLPSVSLIAFFLVDYIIRTYLMSFIVMALHAFALVVAINTVRVAFTIKFNAMTLLAMATTPKFLTALLWGIIGDLFFSSFLMG